MRLPVDFLLVDDLVALHLQVLVQGDLDSRSEVDVELQAVLETTR